MEQWAEPGRSTRVDEVAVIGGTYVVMYDTPSDVDAFERHYNDVHLPLAEQCPGLRGYTRSREPAAVIGEPCDMVVMLDREDMAALEAAPASEIGQRAAEDAAVNLARYATFRGMSLQLDEV
jgi:uncharacterized protein (TIGR02118 family)